MDEKNRRLFGRAVVFVVVASLIIATSLSLLTFLQDRDAQPESTAHTLTAEDPLKFWKQGYEVGYNNAVNECDDKIGRGNRT